MAESDLPNFDELLNLEDDSYYSGVKQGSAENAKHSFIEGKQYGLQVGFQRFLLLGQIAGILDILEISEGDKASFTAKIDAIRNLLNGLKMDNDKDSVADYEDRIIKIKNRFRSLLLMLQRHIRNTGNENALVMTTVEEVSLFIAEEVKGYIEEDSTGSGIEVVRDQVQDW